MYHFTQQPQEPTSLARLPLAKFSYVCTSVNHRGPLTWSHIFGNDDIIGIFEKYKAQRSPRERTTFKVLRGQETLEKIDITELMEEAKSQPHSNQSNLKKPAFAVVVKSPCLAIKYPQENAWIRRFQVKFSCEGDYYTALAILSNLQCPFSEANIGSSQAVQRLTSSQGNWISIRTSSMHDSSYAPDTNGGSMPISHVVPSYSPTAASSIVSSAPTAYSLPSSSSSTTTLRGSNFISRRPSQIPALNINSSFETTDLHPNALIGNLSQDPVRPKTVPASHNIETLSHILPPKRELPFSKPAAKRPRLATKPKDTSVKTLNPEKNQDIQASNLLFTQSGNEGTTATATATATVPDPTPPLNASDEPRRFLYMSTSAPNKSTMEPASFSGIPHTNQGDIVGGGPAISTNSQPSPSLPIPEDLSQFILASTVERTAKIENWICAHLEDDKFLQLCQDVEGVWKRIALGT